MKPSAQWLRHTVQTTVIALVLLAAALGWYGSNLDRDGVDRVLESQDTLIATPIIGAIDQAVRPNETTLGKSQRNQIAHERLQNARGNSWSGEWFGVPLTDPLAGVESVVSQKSLPLALLAGLAIPVGFTLLMGRVFCSWLCPAGFVFELTGMLRHHASRFGIDLKNIRLWRGHKYVLLTTGLVASSLVAIPLLQYLYPPAIFTREAHQLIHAGLNHAAGDAGNRPAWGLTAWGVFLIALIAIEYLLSTRAWCRYICPGGALYSLIGWRRPLRVVRSATRCTHCADCVPVCPMGLNPMNDQMGPECDNCLECVSHCPDDALNLRFTLKTHAPSIGRDAGGAPT